MHTRDAGSPYKVSSKHREEIVAEGDKVFEDSTTVIETRVGNRMRTSSRGTGR